MPIILTFLDRVTYLHVLACFVVSCSAAFDCSLRIDFIEWKNATCSDKQNTGAQVFTHASFISGGISQRPLINYYLIKEGTRYSKPNQSGRWTNVETGTYTVIAVVKESDSISNFVLSVDQPSLDDSSLSILYDSITLTFVDESTLESNHGWTNQILRTACQVSSNKFVVSAPNVLRVNLGKVKPTKDCSGQNGYISLDVHGGVLPIFYSIMNSDFYSYSPTFSDVPSGDHVVVVRDSGGCTLRLNAKVEVSEHCKNPMFNFWSRGGESGIVVLLLSLFLVFLIFQYLYVFIAKKDREIDNFISDAQQTRKRLIESRMTRKKNAEMEANLIEKLLRKEEKRKKKKRKMKKQKKQKKPIQEKENSEEDCLSYSEEKVILPQMTESEGSFQDAYSSMYSLNSINLSIVPSFFFSMLGINYFPNLPMDSLLPFPGFTIPIHQSIIERINSLSLLPMPMCNHSNESVASKFPFDFSAIETRLFQQLQPQIQFFKQQELNDTQMFDVINTLINSQNNLDTSSLESVGKISGRLCDCFANESETATAVETQTLNNLEEQSIDVNDMEKYIEIEENSVEEENKGFEEKCTEIVEDDYIDEVGKVEEESSIDNNCTNESETATVYKTQTQIILEQQRIENEKEYTKTEENSVEEENKVFEKKKEEEKRNEIVEDDYTEIVGKVGEESSGDKEKSDEEKSIEGSEKEN